MDEAHYDHGRRATARLIRLSADTGMAVCWLAMLLSAFEGLAQGGQLLVEGRNVPQEELLAVPDPDELFEKESGHMTTGEAVQILRRVLGVSVEGEARLWRLLSLAADLE